MVFKPDIMPIMKQWNIGKIKEKYQIIKYNINLIEIIKIFKSL